MSTRSAVQWTLVVVLLTTAGIIALWPHGTGPGNTASPLARDSAPAATAGQGVDDRTLEPLRRRAAMQPCPQPSPKRPAPRGRLAGVVAPCLGAPGTVDMGKVVAGRTMLLNVWASWCPPCREEMPVLDRYAAQSGAIPVLGVNVKDRPSAALELAAELGVHYPSISDPDRIVQTALRMPPVVPLNYLVRSDGSVVRITDPLTFRRPEEVRATVRRYRNATP